MSDMSRPQPLHTAPDHELHDPLLVAQAAAGDVLDAADHARAELWTSSCAACASLAAELRSVSAAVAWEPTPTRRRDYRLSAEQADALRGNFVSRFMRRLALPQSTLLRPAAAGVMSIGLAFMLASAVWPVDELRLSTAVPAVAPGDLELRDAGIDPDSASVFRQLASPMPQPRALAPDATANEPNAESADLVDGSDGLELQAFGTEEQAATAAAAAPADGSEALELTVEAPEPAASAHKSADQRIVEQVADEDARVAGESSGLTLEDDDGRGPRDELDTMSLDAASEVEAGTDTSAERAEARDDTSVVGTTTAEAEAAPVSGDRAVDDPLGASAAVGPTGVPDGGVGIETLLLAVGVVLAVGGALVLVLAWLARRRTDPLLR